MYISYLQSYLYVIFMVSIYPPESNNMKSFISIYLDTQALEKSMLYKTDEVYCNNYYTCYYIQVYLECTYFPMNLFFTKKSPCTNIPPSPFFMYDQCHNHSCSQIRIKVEHFSTARSLRNPCVCVYLYLALQRD